MPNRGDRGGARTRARIAEAATGLFLERGFEDVTIAEVAAAAGVFQGDGLRALRPQGGPAARPHPRRPRRRT
ncbi:TetR family transcriptional regulator [Streptomyces sp. NPDC059786]|uniref:TetR family transcriptional regulator n=2 Tax=unclassified Streptomyces TaxID=2593676 RepID=UPI00365B81C1